MGTMPAKDRQRLRSLAQLQLEYANSPQNDSILKKWEAQANGKREDPTVRLLFFGCRGEVIHSRLMCESAEARELESTLLSTLAGRELFDDDTPIAPNFHIAWDKQVSPFGIAPQATFAKKNNVVEGNAKGFHIDPIVCDLEQDFEKLCGGGFYVDRAKTLRRKAFAEEMFGDILPTKMIMPCLNGAITNPLVRLMGMENYYISMYDAPETLHKVMDMATKIYEDFYDYLETEELLLPTAGISPVQQESFAFNCELPADHVEKTTQCWGFLESQETTAISPEMFGEFVFPYQDRLAKRYGLLSYGCCERVDAIWPDYLSKWKNLRKLSVSPFNNARQVGEYLRGSNVVYYTKPRAEFLTKPGPIDEDALRKYCKELFTAASGCLLEVAQREVGTIFGDFARGRRYVQIIKECVQEYWKP